MPNKKYIKGRRKEYKIIHEAKSHGHIALRSAGSHSPIDVIDIDAIERVIRLIQCKSDLMSEKSKEALRQENSQLNGNFFVRFEVI